MLGSVIDARTAYLRGDDWYELRLTDWGRCDATADLRSRIYPLPPPSTDIALPPVVGVAISPWSDVDRCQLTYDIEKKMFSKMPLIDPFSPLEQNVIVVSKERPWHAPLGTASPDDIAQGQLRVLAGNFAYFDYYVPNGAPAPSPFGAAIATSPPTFWAPELRLILFFKEPMDVAPRRAPIMHSSNGVFGPTNGTEALLQVIPIMGRHTVNLKIRPFFNAAPPPAAGTQQFRVTTVHQALRGSPLLHVAEKTFENPVVTSPVLTVTSTKIDQWSMDLTDPGADWLLIYGILSPGAPTPANSLWQFDVEARD